MSLEVLLTLLLALHGAGGRQLSQQDSRYTLRGTVINAATGEPIRGALVQVDERTQLTAANGEFLFEAMPAGTFGFRVQKPGYFSPQDLPNGGTQASIITVGPDQPRVTLKLIPEGIIYGHINGDNGEPLENLPVQLLFDRIENGKRVRNTWRTTTTNEEGQFRLPELLPGKYLLFAGPSPTPAAFPRRMSESSVQGYPAAFYPGVSDAAAAAPIEITAGKHAEINVTLALQPFYRISGTVAGYPPESGVNLQFLNAAGQAIPVGFQLDRNGGFRSGWMPAGLITISAFSHDVKTQQTYFASQKVSVTSDRAGVHLVLAPNVTIPVTMRLERTREDSASGSSSFPAGSIGLRSQTQPDVPARIVLAPADRSLASFRGQYGSELVGSGENRWLGIPNVPPGTYSVQVFPNGPYYVQSARLGTSNLLEDDLTIAPGGSVQAIDIVMRDDPSMLRGTVLLDRQPVSAYVLALPLSNPGPVQLMNSGINGDFQFWNLAPGSYKLLAVDHGGDWEYSNPEVLRKYLSRAREVSVGPGQSASVELELIPVESKDLESGLVANE